MTDLFEIDAIELLTQDHREVSELFEKYDQLVEDEGAADAKGDLATLICRMLTVHAAIEEEIFYPQARTVLDDESMIDEAYVEHAGAKDLIAEILAMEPTDDGYDAKVKLLNEEIAQHVAGEEDELFPEVQDNGLDINTVGAQLSARKDELMSRLDDEIEAGEDGTS